MQELSTTINPGKDWITYGGALNGQRYSTLTQINPGNVQTLRGAWLTRLGSGRGGKYKFEADPLVIDGVMYIPTGNDDIFALDGKTGSRIWEYNSDIPQTNDLICCGWDNRGVAAGEGKLFSGQLDGSFVALDQKTGTVAWRTQLEDYHDGYSITGATRYFDGLVFTGMSGGENGVRGRVYALDAQTGREVWRFYTVPDPASVGGDSWPAGTDAYLRGGATVWQAPAVDPDLGMIYFSTGNAGPDNDGSVRAGNNLFSASIVALDYKSGQYKWHFQEVHHDIWDFDAPSPVVLFDQTYNGQLKKGLYQAGKTGFLYFLDRTNGTPLIGIDEKPVPQEPRQATAATQPIPVGDEFVASCAEPLPDFPLAGCRWDTFWDLPVLLLYGSGAGSQWSPTCYSPQTGYVYVMGNGPRDGAVGVMPQPYVQGKRYTSGQPTTPLGAAIKSTFSAVDSRTNKIAWQKVEDGETSYGVLCTASGLVFRGRPNGNLEAYDAKTGEVLWSFQTGWGISAPPMTYEIDGVQYVTVASGGNRGGVTTTDGDAVWGLALNGNIDEVPAPPAVQTRIDFSGAFIKPGEPTVSRGGIGDDILFEGTLSMQDYYFAPQRVSVPVGTTVSWRNDGSVVHTATEQKRGWDTGDVPAGDSKSVTFDTPGTYTYSCTPHPWMVAQIRIE
jgi:alcohol dehydrogenase (cytochrome c)